ncbi:hypothetical protein [Melioribacter sp. OK-6-Me]|uniref:hypothetical protein n=1 Tax=unclassified Melioribacter TaxID=2627329 RepID=UPI003ED9241D
MKQKRLSCLNKKFLLIFLFSIGICNPYYSQHNSVYVDNNGVLRWSESHSEIRLFGVNYTAPFAFSYNAMKNLGIDIKKAIEIDVKHLVRLGVKAYRIHMWDREISDREGNLLNNEHIELFDYLLMKLKENGIKIILTPIAWWGTRWPMPDVETPGFSQIYTKQELLTNPVARTAQKNYLKQVINHVNRFTGISYKDEPSIIAVEIINEPHHPEDPDVVTQYINEMYEVLRGEGFAKPIFYNISENWSNTQAQAVSNSKVEGVSFQWYPTGLVHNKMLEGNYLFNVDEYKIPSETITGFDRKAKMVYEFDAADIGYSYMYLAMARSFREAGMQFATVFSYDPAQIAWSNTEYQTHFINLLYTPSKAIGMMIAAKAFELLPHKKSYGRYPENKKFDVFLIDQKNDLALMNCDTAFFYSNNTDINPIAPEKLKHIAGVGKSSLVDYEGNGAYFLDKIDNGLWKLEIYPDAVWLNDPFEQTSLKREIARLYFKKHKIKFNLGQLGKTTRLYSFEGNYTLPDSFQSFLVQPGVYLLSSYPLPERVVFDYLSDARNFLSDIYMPDYSKEKINVYNRTTPDLIPDGVHEFKFTIASEKEVVSTELYVRRLGWRGFKKFNLQKISAYEYRLSLKDNFFSPGIFEYCIVINTEDGKHVFPGGGTVTPEDWDFNPGSLWRLDITDSCNAILYDPLRDRKDLVFPHFAKNMKYTLDYKMGTTSSYLTINVSYSDSSSMAFGFQNNIDYYLDESNCYNYLVLHGYTDSAEESKIKVNLLTNDGAVYSYDLMIDNLKNEYRIRLEDFKLSEALLLPNSYPQFLPRKRKSINTSKTLKENIGNLVFLQIENIPTTTGTIEFSIGKILLTK